MKIENVNVGDLNPAEYNPRDISEEELKGLESSIKKFGFVEPIVVNTIDNIVVGGHQRLKVAQKMGINTIPVSYVTLNKTDEKALNITLNNQEISGKYNTAKLEELLSELKIDLQEEEFTELRLEELAESLELEESFSNDETKQEVGENYKEIFNIVVECKNENEQEKIFNELIKKGYKCQVQSL